MARLQSPITLAQLGDGKWSATMETDEGPVTAIGGSPAEAVTELDQLVAIARAVEVARRNLRG